MIWGQYEAPMKIHYWMTIVGLGVLLVATSLVAQPTYISGEVSGVWTAAYSPYIAESTLYIPADKVLLINEGVEVYFLGNDSLSVYGKLIVQGTAANGVYFGRHESNSIGWKGIFFKPGANDDSEINYATITGTFVGVTVSHCNASVRHSNIESESRGLVLRFANGYYEDNRIECSFLTATGVYALKSSAKLLRNDIVVESTNSLYISFGIYANLCHQAVLERNTVHIFGVGDHYGIFFDDCDHIVINFNLIQSFSQYISSAIYGVYSFQPVIRNNTLITWSASIDKGVSCVNANAFITNNIIIGDGQSIGIYCRDCMPDICYNDVWNHSTNYEGCLPGERDISANPLFVGGEPYNYHLISQSPCIDAGNPLYIDPDGTVSDMGAFYYHQTAVSIPGDATVPDQHWLGANYPNPFNSETVIPFALSRRSHLTLEVFTVTGRRVACLLDDEADAGQYQILWSAGSLPSGIYFYRMEAGNDVFHGKAVLLK
jgi:hypothetical protein